MTTKQRKEIIAEIKRYPRRKDKVAEKITDVCERGMCCKYEKGGSGYKSAREVRDFTDGLYVVAERRDYRWCLAIENALRHYEETEISDIIRYRYMTKKYPESYVCTAAAFNVSIKTLYLYEKSFFDMVHKYAIKYGLMDVE